MEIILIATFQNEQFNKLFNKPLLIAIADDDNYMKIIISHTEQMLYLRN